MRTIAKAACAATAVTIGFVALHQVSTPDKAAWIEPSAPPSVAERKRSTTSDAVRQSLAEAGEASPSDDTDPCARQAWPNIAPECLKRTPGEAGRKTVRVIGGESAAAPPAAVAAAAAAIAAAPVREAKPSAPEPEATGALPAAVARAEAQEVDAPVAAKPARRLSEERRARVLREHRASGRSAYASFAGSAPAPSPPRPSQPIQFSLADRGSR